MEILLFHYDYFIIIITTSFAVIFVIVIFIYITRIRVLFFLSICTISLVHDCDEDLTIEMLLTRLELLKYS